MIRPELKKPSRGAGRKRRRTQYPGAKRRISVSEAKTHLSAVLKQAQDGHRIIVTDHGKDIASIQGINEVGQLRLVQAQRPFSEVRGIRAPIQATAKSAKSILELLKEERDSR